jgi:type I restriction enzyme S subunit
MQGEIKPGYVQTEVGVIPEDWGYDKLHRFVVEHRSGIYKKSATYGDGCNIVGVADIYGISAVDGRIFNRVPLSKDELKIFVLQPGDLLYGESSLVREGIARLRTH